MQVKAEVAAQNMMESRSNANNTENYHEWLTGNATATNSHTGGGGHGGVAPHIHPTYHQMYPISPQSSLESGEYCSSSSDGINEREFCLGGSSKKRPFNTTTTDLGELQALALRMMRN